MRLVCPTMDQAPRQQADRGPNARPVAPNPSRRAIVTGSRGFISFHHMRHPSEMGGAEINASLTHLIIKQHVSAPTQNQALSALLFLCRQVFDREIGELGRGHSCTPTAAVARGQASYYPRRTVL